MRKLRRLFLVLLCSFAANAMLDVFLVAIAIMADMPKGIAMKAILVIIIVCNALVALFHGKEITRWVYE